MNRKRLRKLQASFAKRGGQYWSSPDAPPEIEAAFLEQLLECPDCRAAVLEACGVESDEALRAMAHRRDH